MTTFDVDLHAHTRFFHRWPGDPTSFDPVGARLLGHAARLRGLDGIAFTNHDYFRKYRAGPVGASDGSETTVLPGIEISTTDGHVLVVGPDPPQRTEPGALAPEEAVELAHDRDCAAILPHPFRRGDLWKRDLDVDAVEVNGKRPQVAERVKVLADECDLPIVGGSDAHFSLEVGRVHTRLEAPALTPEAVVQAIRDGRVWARIAETRLHRWLRRAYREIHEFKGHVTGDPTPITVQSDEVAGPGERDDGRPRVGGDDE